MPAAPETPTVVEERSGRPMRITEIDGLRGVALTLVVLFHLFGQGRVSGGVDVFLVVSGFLLTGSLLRTLSDGRPVRVRQRWTRSIVRLTLPAVPVALFIIVLSFTVLAPWTREQHLIEVLSSLLYVENWTLIASQLAYGAAGPETSPAQHFWSLSVQMQVLLALPLLAWAVAKLTARPAHRAVAFYVLIAVLTAASFIAALIRNAANPAEAYFDTFARFWELGAGGLVAVALHLGWAPPARVAMPLGWVGLAVVAGCGFLIDGSAVYPGPLALVPVAGALAVIAASATPSRDGVGRVLRSSVLSRLDALSFPLYLWHWPVLIGFLAMFGSGEQAISSGGAAAVLAISVLLALGSRHGVQPITERLVRGARPAVAIAVPALLVAVLVAPIAFVLAAPAPVSSTASPADRECAGADMLGSTDGGCVEIESYDAAAIQTQMIAAESGPDAPVDDSPCWTGGAEPLRWCTLGPEADYDRHLLAVGDSHNNVLLNAYEPIAERNGWRIDVVSRGTCYWTDALRKQSAPRWVEACADWQSGVEELIASFDDLDGIIVRNSFDAPLTIEEGDDIDEVRVSGYVAAWSDRPDPEVPVIALQGVPHFSADTMDCLEGSPSIEVVDCSAPRSEVMGDGGLAEAVRRSENAHLIDLSDLLCSPERCSLILGGVLVTADGSHLTVPYIRTLVPYLERSLQAVLGR